MYFIAVLAHYHDLKLGDWYTAIYLHARIFWKKIAISKHYVYSKSTAV